MKKERIILPVVFLLLIVAGLTQCKGKKDGAEGNTSVINPAGGPETVSESSLLLNELEKNGDYVNSRNFPSLIRASVVYEELEGNNLLIDLRDRQSYLRGHVRDAVNVSFSDLPDYFESAIRPFEYERIIMVCGGGQLSSYAASLLRLMGYGNVYAMRWGMSGWNMDCARESWLGGISGKYENQLETTANEVPAPAEMPDLKTGYHSGNEILDARFRKLFAEGIDSVLISAGEVFKNPGQYFIINFERKDKYEDGHIPGAVRYKPDATLGFPDVMSTIPPDQVVVVYCGTGHNSGFATAFLRLFGYDARTLRYGNNSFMYDRMIRDKSRLSWLPFTADESENFPLVK
ncbi:MAG: hypothetical protein GX876_06335 [Bacteroidales bacterium]|nr:hypothetical protein [Bacteroidales bacterium]